MDVKKYQFGSNLIYEVENLNDETFNELDVILKKNNSLIEIEGVDLKHISCGYKKLMIGLGKMSELDDLLNLYDLHKDCDALCVEFRGEYLTAKQIEDTLIKIRKFFVNELNIIYGVTFENFKYDIVLYVPIIKDFWMCPRCNKYNLLSEPICKCCKREQPF